MNSPRSSSLFAEARKYIPGGVNSPVRAFRGVGGEPFFVERAEGSHLWDADGRELIDYVGTWGPAILGHAPRVVLDAITATAQRGVSFGIPHALEVEMARTICEWVPSIEKVRMVNSAISTSCACGIPKLTPFAAVAVIASSTTRGAWPRMAGPHVPT